MNFKELREKYLTEKAKVVFSKKIGKISVRIEKKKDKEFVLLIDNEVLDTYKTQKEAERSAEVFAKETK
jgi:hypothetical protein